MTCDITILLIRRHSCIKCVKHLTGLRFTLFVLILSVYILFIFNIKRGIMIINKFNCSLSVLFTIKQHIRVDCRLFQNELIDV